MTDVIALNGRDAKFLRLIADGRVWRTAGGRDVRRDRREGRRWQPTDQPISTRLIRQYQQRGLVAEIHDGEQHQLTKAGWRALALWDGGTTAAGSHHPTTEGTQP